MKKSNTMSITHKIDGRSKNLLVVTTLGEVNAVQSVTFRGAELDRTVRKKHWIWKRKFPFLERKEIGIYTTVIKPKKKLKVG